MRAYQVLGLLLAFMILSVGCRESQSPFGAATAPVVDPKQEEYDARYQQQLDRTATQLDELDRQTKRQDALLNKTEKHQQRDDALMAKREEQARRIDALIERWERITAAAESEVKAKGE